MKVSLFKFAILSGLVISLASCSSPKTAYKDFYKSQSFQKAGVLADATVLQDAKGKAENLLAQESATLLQTIQQGVSGQLQAKGYQTISQYQSTGLSIPSDMVAFVSDDRKATEGTVLSGAHTITQGGQVPSKIQSYAAERLFERLLPLNLLSKSAQETTFPEVKDLGIPSDRYLVVVSGIARNVNASKQVGQALLLAAISLGTVVAWESDSAMIQVALIDPRTQKIAWANQTPGGGGKKESVDKTIAKLFKSLPAYGTRGE